MADLVNRSWGYPMPFKHVIKVSDSVYEKLQELMKATGAKSPNQALETLLSELDHRVTPIS
jgi:predicted CopG family antitoxin